MNQLWGFFIGAAWGWIIGSYGLDRGWGIPKCIFIAVIGGVATEVPLMLAGILP